MGKFDCLSLTGMPGVGKTTVGRILAEMLGWAFMDTDFLLESFYGCPLQEITDHFGKDEFVRIEGTIVASINAHCCVLATGGSVVYNQEAMRHLSELGPVVCLLAELPVIRERISHAPQRGIAIAPGQTLEDLFAERMRLYKSSSDLICDATYKTPDQCAQWIFDRISIGEPPAR